MCVYVRYATLQKMRRTTTRPATLKAASNRVRKSMFEVEFPEALRVRAQYLSRSLKGIKKSFHLTRSEHGGPLPSTGS